MPKGKCRKFQRKRTKENNKITNKYTPISKKVVREDAEW